ncbi:UDP-glucuronic acid decarboxylase family protein [Nocardioides sp. Kera G14]|uniref:UDP-glucuronic acid decarboxylase family protein n=1 Tax=Nocardioides sp. Kera G14 TaxID=2884264 RepID=UPI001D10D2E8|nr:UDP-glucuronic acid decarboxylase family protein [Nocardioides sp. Kera G14]UDY24975.1 SDR family oxidoreductase [Nocardioides sp. Kera G14]
MSVDLAGARVLVTGGAGFVGSWLCERLLDEGATVWAVDSFMTGSPDKVAHLVRRPGFTLVEADVSETIPDPGGVTHVMHLACPASPVHYLRLPLETLRVASNGTVNALELAERHGARLVLASTSEVYGDPLEHPQRESYWGNVNPIGPRSVYDEGKRFAEATTMAFHRERGVDVGIARIFNTYGPRMSVDDGRVVPTFLHQALQGKPLTVAGDGSQTRSLCWVEDTVDGLVRLACSNEVGPVNLGNDAETTMLELAETVVHLTGSRSSIEHVALPQDDPKVRRPDISHARRTLGWVPTMTAEEGLKRTVRWMEELLAG